ncbi:hypothetical protein [Campylobacter troglodytis]|uniref:hypothetical protein n=1 Tax=Campylobacter troglodytis TaxID=654363 RepID=UPI00163BEC16|nr:hypothetical protein [Campylobacter troglodytis]
MQKGCVASVDVGLAKMPMFSFRALATVNKRLVKAKSHEFIRSSIAPPKSSCLL